jgi:hypothetical protein
MLPGWTFGPLWRSRFDQRFGIRDRWRRKGKRPPSHCLGFTLRPKSPPTLRFPPLLKSVKSVKSVV